MNNQRARYVWDYDLTQEQFDAMLAGDYVDGHLNRDWAAVRLIEWAPYREMIQRLGYKALVDNWPRWRNRLRSAQQIRSIDFLVDWLPKHHPELLGEMSDYVSDKAYYFEQLYPLQDSDTQPDRRPSDWFLFDRWHGAGTILSSAPFFR